MEAAAVALVGGTVFVWAVVSARLGRADLSAPIVFVSMGLLLSVLHLLQPDLSREAARSLAEVTLVWVLFGDASRVKLRAFRDQLGLYARLLGVGLPLTIAAGALLAVWLLDGTSAWMALVVGAALAPTDAALGASVSVHWIFSCVFKLRCWSQPACMSCTNFTPRSVRRRAMRQL